MKYTNNVENRKIYKYKWKDQIYTSQVYEKCVGQDKYSVRLLKRPEIVEQYRHHMDLKFQKRNADDPMNKTWETIKLVIKNSGKYCVDKK